MKLKEVKSFKMIRMPAGEDEREIKVREINRLMGYGWEIIRITEDGDGWGYVYLGHRLPD